MFKSVESLANDLKCCISTFDLHVLPGNDDSIYTSFKFIEHFLYNMTVWRARTYITIEELGLEMHCYVYGGLVCTAIKPQIQRQY